MQRWLGNQGVRQLLAPAQAKLRIGSPSDPAEREAERLADQLTRTDGPVVQRKCAGCSSGEPCEECKKKNDHAEVLQRKPASASPVPQVVDDVRARLDPGGASSECGIEGDLRRSAEAPAVTQQAPAAVHQVLRSPGQPLDAATRAFFEPRLGIDLGHVSVHIDALAAQSARAVDALAYTVDRQIVFGAGQYAPETAQGKKLLAHELAHVQQQAGGARSGGTAMLQRQCTAPACAPAQAPPAAGGWSQCCADKIPQLNQDLADAVSWVDEAVHDLANADSLPRHTKGALGRYLTADPAQVRSTILPALRTMLTELQGGPANFRCCTQHWCSHHGKGGSGITAWSTHPISLCDKEYFSDSDLNRVATLIHETGHHAGLGGDTYAWEWPFPGLSVNQSLQNADSFAAFVLVNHYPSLPPETGPKDREIRLGFGQISPSSSGAASQPRYVITAEFGGPLAQRVFHFFDLKGHLVVDVDSSGHIIGSGLLGARVFAPTSVSRVPLFLDLDAGVTLGRDPTVVDKFDRNVVGLTAEARVGVQAGHFEASVGYRKIWSVMQDTPDLHEVWVTGGILF
jgi:hypothetical protein